MKIRKKNNDKCVCGSGKRYADCCKKKELVEPSLYQKLTSGQIPFSARVMATTEEGTSMKIKDVAVTIDGKMTDLVTNEMTLETNAIKGDKVAGSTALLSVLPSGTELGAITTIGNASVSNSQTCKINLGFANGIKKCDRESTSGIYVRCSIKFDSTSHDEYFDVVFGIKHQSEVNAAGEKIRPHVTFYSSGADRYLRFVKYNCELESESLFDPEDQIIRRMKYRITSKDMNEAAEITFSFDSSGTTLLLDDVNFTNMPNGK